MQRFAVIAALLLPCAFGQAQTSIKITMPDTSSCTYHTGQISSNATPGQLQATATDTGTSGGTGNGCGTAGNPNPPVSFGPASPLSPNPLTLPSTASGGETSSFSFKAFNATSCIGSITGAGAVFANGTNSTSICTGASCGNAQNLSVTFPSNPGPNNNTYTVTANCTGPGSVTAVPTTAAVTVTPFVQGSACPLIPSSTGGSFSQVAGTINLAYSGHPTASVNITDFVSIYRGTSWPAQYNWIALFSLRKDGYISAGFKPAANYFSASNAPANLYGEIYVAPTNFTAPVSMTISTNCGDFSTPGTSGSSVVDGCYGNLTGADQAAVVWQKAGTGHTCVLTGGTQYYLNIINADISGVTASGGSAVPTCTSPSCTDPVSNGPGNWLGYTPN